MKRSPLIIASLLLVLGMNLVAEAGPIRNLFNRLRSRDCECEQTYVEPQPAEPAEQPQPAAKPEKAAVPTPAPAPAPAPDEKPAPAPKKPAPVPAVKKAPAPKKAEAKMAAPKPKSEWINLFNGKDLTGWKISDNGKWEVKNGEIIAQGARSHLYTESTYKNFEFKAEVMTEFGANSGIYFHTKFQETGWPAAGYETQVNVTHHDPVKTGSLYGVVKLFETDAQDNKWWEQNIIVKGKHIVVKIDGKKVIDYVEPNNVEGTRRISEGAFALQAHDPNSVTHYRNIRVKRLPD